MKTFSKILLDWYRLNKRDLPWRDTKDPYRIWISEIILQQTRVAQGYDYFLRFVERFPNVQTLALASEDEVLKYWEGLGYYSRARNLHEAARNMNGRFPASYEEVRAMKGVGDYTAAAICSFAYRMPYAVVDGNVCRVLARVFGVEDSLDCAAGKKKISALARQVLDKKCPDDHNQAIMDFGALQCVPFSPRCEICPFKKRCAAFRSGLVEDLPRRAKKTKVSPRFFTYIYVKQSGRTWLRRREGKDIWTGLYEFPLLETSANMSERELEETALWRNTFAGCSPRFLWGPVTHILSHQKISACFYEVCVSSSFALPKPFIRVERSELPNYAFPRLLQKFMQKTQWLKP